MRRVAVAFLTSNLRYEEVYPHMIDAALDTPEYQVADDALAKIAAMEDDGRPEF